MYTPSSTYRIQLHREFNFNQLENIIDYLHNLGISTIYASPVMRAVKGSNHGYDGLNPQEINPEIGTVEQWKKISQKLREYHMGWLQDIVPNHMAYDLENRWLFDLLERGADSRYYAYFDIISQYHEEGIGEEKLMFPFLAESLENCLGAGKIRVAFLDNGLYIQYEDKSLPVAPASYLWLALQTGNTPSLKTWCELLAGAANKFFNTEEWGKRKAELLNDLHLNKALYEEMIKSVEAVNADSPSLNQFLRLQNYELTHWETSRHRMNYRRFFAVNSLICLRMEDPVVFNDWHQWISSMYHQQLIQGFRIDHIDGLYHPEQYLQRLRSLAGQEAYIISEKILQAGEAPVPSWPSQGTSGYDFLSYCNQLMTDEEGKKQLVAFYEKEICPGTYRDLVFEKKYAFLKKELQGELANLLRLLLPCFEELQIKTNIQEMEEAVSVLMSAFPVYRIYSTLPLSATDLGYIQLAFETARRIRPELEQPLTVLEKIFKILPSHPAASAVSLFLRRFAQYTAPLAAKGVEDTVFYNYNALISHNEVGDSPDHPPVSATGFHDLMITRLRQSRFSLNTASTHDTKRGEDNRLRINLITRYPVEWIDLIRSVREINKKFLGRQEKPDVPSLNDEYMIYQALVGSLPVDLEITNSFLTRFRDYLRKAQREAKAATTWSDPNEEYESKSFEFVKQILHSREFTSLFFPFVEKIIRDSFIYSLSQTLIRLTAPGIPDIYQGSESWDISLVDPDNRALVDYEKRKNILNDLAAAEKESSEKMLATAEHFAAEGAQKLLLIRQILQFRKEITPVFDQGMYVPVPCGKGWIAYIRKWEQEEILILAPTPVQENQSEKHSSPLASVTGGRWKNLITGKEVFINDTLEPSLLNNEFPVGAFKRIND